MSNLVVSADNGNLRMEAETILINGASSKSHTSRRYFLKIACFAVLAAGIVFSGCKKIKEYPSSPFDGKITAKVENANAHANVSKIVALAKDQKIAEASYSNGNFTMTLPATPDAKFLVDTWDLFGNGIEYEFNEDFDPKLAIVDVFQALDGDGDAVDELTYAKLDNSAFTYAIFVYSNMEITFWGTLAVDGTAVEVTFKNGWNTLYYTTALSTETTKCSTKAVSGLIWHFDSDLFDEE